MVAESTAVRMDLEPEKKYRTLRVIAWLCKTIGIIIVAAPAIFCVFAMIAGVSHDWLTSKLSGIAWEWNWSREVGQMLSMSLAVVIILVCAFLVAAPFFAFGELIMVFLETEEHARVTRMESERMSQTLYEIKQGMSR